MKSTVERWQQGRPAWNYSPALQFWYRFVLCTLADAMQVEDGKPTDEAILARDWFATSTPGVEFNGRREFVSFDECCHWLGLDADVERVGILFAIDENGDFDTDEVWARLAELSESEPEGTDALFDVPDMFRVVPVRDQLSLLAAIN